MDVLLQSHWAELLSDSCFLVLIPARWEDLSPTAFYVATSAFSSFNCLYQQYSQWPDVHFYQLRVHKAVGLVKSSETAEYSVFLLEPRCSRFVRSGLWSSAGETTQKNVLPTELVWGSRICCKFLHRSPMLWWTSPWLWNLSVYRLTESFMLEKTHETIK